VKRIKAPFGGWSTVTSCSPTCGMRKNAKALALQSVAAFKAVPTHVLTRKRPLNRSVLWNTPFAPSLPITKVMHRTIILVNFF
jgi:hypothetical protein